MGKHIKITDVEASQLRYGKACPKGHSTVNGRGLRFKKSGHCIGCRFDLPAGLLDIPIVGPFDEPPRSSIKKYDTDEERRAARVRAQIAWNSRNKDKCKVYLDKYNSSEERKKRISELSSIKYQENKEAIKERRKKHYEANRERIRAQGHAYYEANKERLLQKRIQKRALKKAEDDAKNI